MTEKTASSESGASPPCQMLHSMLTPCPGLLERQAANLAYTINSQHSFDEIGGMPSKPLKTASE